MTPISAEGGGTALTLLPHQSKLVESVFAPTGKRFTLLRGQVGLGKGTALAALAVRMLLENHVARVLLIAPAALRDQFADRLRQQGAQTVIADRYYYRERLDVAAEIELWPSGTVVILSPEFARQPDVRASLSSIRWDLVIADEAHLLKGANAEVLLSVAVAAGRVVLSTLPHLGPPDGFPLDDITLVDWNWETILDRDGVRVAPPLQLQLNEISYRLSPIELDLSKVLEALAHEFEGVPEQASIGQLLRRSRQSSAAALERILETLARRLAPAEVSADDSENAGDELGQYRALTSRELPSPAAAIMLEQLRQVFDAVDKDSKLAALVELLVDLTRPAAKSARVCVIADYVATQFYIAAEMESQGQRCLLSNATMSRDTRSENLARFMSEGGILVAGRSLMTAGFDVKGITDLVFFDVPASKDTLHQILGRVDRFGRTSPLTVHVLVPADASTAEVARPGLDVLRAAVKGQSDPPR